MAQHDRAILFQSLFRLLSDQTSLTIYLTGLSDHCTTRAFIPCRCYRAAFGAPFRHCARVIHAAPSTRARPHRITTDIRHITRHIALMR